MAYEWLGEYFTLLTSKNKFKNNTTGELMTSRKTCQVLNMLYSKPVQSKEYIDLYFENEWRKQYQRELEYKIHRLKKRISILEK